MRTLILLTIILTLFQGCLFFTDKGISTNLYNDCVVSYDAFGQYKKECEDILIDYHKAIYKDE